MSLRLRILALAALFAVLGLTATGAYLYLGVYGFGDTLGVGLRNASVETVTRGNISAFGENHPFGAIEPGGSTALSFSYSGEGSYTVEVEFESGRRLSSRFGYLTPGFSFDDVLDIRENEIVQSASTFRSSGIW
ncbi:MAG: hypothetical protein RH982_08385 [Parvibaculum sp.]